MPTSSDQSLDAWIASRKKIHTTDLSRATMMEIQGNTQTVPLPSHKTKPSSLLITSTCLLAGIGKISLIYHFAF